MKQFLHLLILVLFCFCNTQDKVTPPNIIFILTDDQGFGDLGVYGATDIKTPNLDRLAGEGARFTSYYAT